MNPENFALQAYSEIMNKSNTNMFLQGVSSVFGGLIVAGMDTVAIGTHHIPMCNNIRRIFARNTLDNDYIISLITNLMNECISDIKSDKAFGYIIPLITIESNVKCAKTITWRLGTLFALLASQGEEIELNSINDCMFVICKMFPHGETEKSLLPKPEKEIFIQMVVTVYNIKYTQFIKKIDEVKGIFC